jgi:hypothetical protein
MSDTDLKQLPESQEPIVLENPEPSPNAVIEVLPPVLREIPHTRHHVKDEQLGLQIRDMAKLGLGKQSTALAARVTPYILEKYYLDEFLEGQADMQRGLAAKAVSEAMDGNTAILLHLLKTKLGWSEHQTLEISGEIRNVVSSKPLTKAEFIQRYLLQDGKEGDGE